MDETLRSTLLTLADTMRDAHDSWWIIASAAAVLHGADISVHDVDLLVSRRDGEALLARLAPIQAPAPSDRFRSDLFGCWTGAPLPVDIMAGFHVLGPDGWAELQPATRIAIPLGDATLPVPAIPELIAHCHLFSRPKDLARAAILQRLGHDPAMRPRSA